MRAEHVTWIDSWTPEEVKHKKRLGSYPKWAIVQYKTNQSDLPYYMNREEYEIYLKEKDVLKALKRITTNSDDFTELVKLVEAYGEAREQQGREDAIDGMSED